jgi:hypothetical protein
MSRLVLCFSLAFPFLATVCAALADGPVDPVVLVQMH